MKTENILLAAALSAVVAATSYGDIRAVTPTAWNGDTNCWQMVRHKAKKAEIKETKQ